MGEDHSRFGKEQSRIRYSSRRSAHEPDYVDVQNACGSSHQSAYARFGRDSRRPIGGTHVFKSNGILYNVEHGGFFRMPGGVVHEAWLPAGSQTLNILESGWAVNWVDGGPSEEDMDQYPPTTAR